MEGFGASQTSIHVAAHLIRAGLEVGREVVVAAGGAHVQIGHDGIQLVGGHPEDESRVAVEAVHLAVLVAQGTQGRERGAGIGLHAVADGVELVAEAVAGWGSGGHAATGQRQGGGPG